MPLCSIYCLPSEPDRFEQLSEVLEDGERFDGKEEVKMADPVRAFFRYALIKRLWRLRARSTDENAYCVIVAQAFWCSSKESTSIQPFQSCSLESMKPASGMYFIEEEVG
ncbi:MAG: hypothetical protein OEV17_02050, partial [Nitrospira sp.]|nr:hypothetical protein [Nitrospira sp.]